MNYDRNEALKKLIAEIQSYASEGMATARKSRYAPEPEPKPEPALEAADSEEAPEDELVKDMSKAGDSAEGPGEMDEATLAELMKALG